MAQIFSLKNSKFFSGLKKICAIVAPITTQRGAGGPDPPPPVKSQKIQGF